MKAILTSRVLLLNSSYEPLGTISVARSICLVIREAVFVEDYDADHVLRSVKETFRVPSVVRLKEYVNVRKRRRASGAKRLRIYVRDRFTCQYCGKRKAAGELTLDHITPRAQGGESTPENLVTACASCNGRKADRTPDQARMPLLISQHELSVGLDHVMLCHYAEDNPGWHKYLFIEERARGKRTA